MKVLELIDIWNRDASGQLTQEEYRVRLTLEEAAKLEALAEMFPRRTREQLITELLTVALDELVSSFPYVEGKNVIARDEEGDPIFADVGYTPRYLSLIKKHLDRLASREPAL